MQGRRDSFTIKANGLLRELKTDVLISQAFDPASSHPRPPQTSFSAIWDTGATNTAISLAVVELCQLKPIGRAILHTANGEGECNTYLINIFLPNRVGFVGVKATGSKLPSGTNVLIGMDVIGQGDFGLTNMGGHTWFSFRVPSIERFDFVVVDKAYNERRAQKSNKPKVQKRRKKR